MEVLFRGTTEAGFNRSSKMYTEFYSVPRYGPSKKYTTDWVQALGYAMQYAVEYRTNGLVIVLLNSDKYRFSQFTNEWLEILDPINLSDTLILREGQNLDDLCAFPRLGVYQTREVTRRVISEIRRNFERT